MANRYSRQSTNNTTDLQSFYEGSRMCSYNIVSKAEILEPKSISSEQYKVHYVNTLVMLSRNNRRWYIVHRRVGHCTNDYIPGYSA